jgi:hypothetical protein
MKKSHIAEELSDKIHNTPKIDQMDENSSWQRILIFSSIVFVICLLTPLVAPTVTAGAKVWQAVKGSGSKVAAML